MFTIDFIESKERFKSPLLQSASSSGGEGVVYLLNTASLLVSSLFWSFCFCFLLFLCSCSSVSLFGYSRKNSKREGWGWIRISSDVKNVEFPSCGLLWNFRLEFPRSMQNFRRYCTFVPPIVIDDSSWKNAAESFTVVLTLTLGGGVRKCNSTKFPVQGLQAWWKPVSSRISMLRVKQQISFHQLLDIGKGINFSNCYGLEMTLF